MNEPNLPRPDKRKAVSPVLIELPESEVALQSLLEAIPIPMTLVRRADSQVLFVNTRMQEYFDVPADTIVGRRTTDFYLHLEDRKKLDELLEQQGYVHDFEVRTKGPNGKLYWLSVSLQSLIYRGEPCALAGLLDLTERREAKTMFAKERRMLTRLLEVHERDRQLIGFEIHDGIVQDMTATVMFLEAASNDIAQAGGEVPESLERGMTLLRGGINEARRLINGLQPPVLDEAGVVAAIENLKKEVQVKSGLEVRFFHDKSFPRLAPALEMAIYRIVQEALNNVWQHSFADSADVHLAQHGDRVEIRIIDQGQGFDPATINKKRYGVVGMRERARLLGGQATIDSAPGKGTQIWVELPIADLLLPDTVW